MQVEMTPLLTAAVAIPADATSVSDRPAIRPVLKR
jgi:hypothetical protein